MTDLPDYNTYYKTNIYESKNGWIYYGVNIIKRFVVPQTLVLGANIIVLLLNSGYIGLVTANENFLTLDGCNEFYLDGCNEFVMLRQRNPSVLIKHLLHIWLIGSDGIKISKYFLLPVAKFAGTKGKIAGK